MGRDRLGRGREVEPEEDVNPRISSAAAGTDKKTLLNDLAKVDQFTASLKVPLRNLDTTWLELRQYLHDMRDRVKAL